MQSHESSYRKVVAKLGVIPVPHPHGRRENKNIQNTNSIYESHTAHTLTVVKITHPNDRCRHALVGRFKAFHISAETGVCPQQQFCRYRKNTKRTSRGLIFEYFISRRILFVIFLTEA